MSTLRVPPAAVLALVILSNPAVAADDEISYRIQWSRIADYPVRLSELSAIAMQGRIYVIGGKNTRDNMDLADNQDVDFNYEYDPGANQWTQRAGLPTAQYDVALAALEGRIYAIGSANESYDPASDRWSRHNPLPNGGAHLEAAAAGSEIFVFSAESPKTANRNMAFNPKTGVWRERAPMPTPRLFNNAIALGGKVYVMGGIGYDAQGRLGPIHNVVEVYDPAADRWEARRPMPDGVFGAAGAGVVDGKILLVGASKGERLSDIKATGDVYVYDPATDRWGRATPVPHNHGGAGVAFLDGRIYVVGGHNEGFVQFREAYAGTIERAGDSELPGRQLLELPRLNAEILAHHVPRQMQAMRDGGKAIAPEADQLAAKAKRALDTGDSYRAYRLLARAFGLAHGPAEMLAYDVAAAFALKLNQAIFRPADTIDILLEPAYDVGTPLPGAFRARLWLETVQGVVPNTERILRISEIGRQRVSYPAANVPSGVVSVGYELLNPEGQSLVRVYYSFAVMAAGRPSLAELQALVAALRAKPELRKAHSLSLALDTAEYVVEGLARETAGYSGHWRRWLTPLAVRFGGGAERPGLWGPVRCPEDIDFALEIIRDLQAGRDPLANRRGDMRLATRLSGGGLMSFRLFVPEGASQKLRGLIVALHSGAGDQSFFEWEASSLPAGRPYVNAFKTLAQKLGFMAACPSGYGEVGNRFDGEQGVKMATALVERLQAVYPVPSGSAFLTGWSIGSLAAWRIGMQRPERFAGMALIAGEASWLTQRDAAAAAKLPVLFITGDRDFSIQQARKTRDLAQQYLPLFRYMELPNTEHGDTWPRGLESVFQFFDEVRSSSERGTAPGVGGGASDGPKRSYLQERAQFRTKLTRTGPAPAAQALSAPPAGLQSVAYSSGDLKLQAWLSAPQAADGKRSPALVFFHGGFELNADYVEMARPFQDAGFVVMFPTLRGENGNPGHFEMLLGEVDDAAAAVRWLASQPYVDPTRIYTYGHSAGGRVSLMLSLRDDVPVRIGGSSAGVYTADGLKRWADRAPFDAADDRERRIRAPFDFVHTMGHRHLTFAGRQEYSAERIAEFKRLAAGTKLEIREVEGDHMGCVKPAIAEFLRAITPLTFRSGQSVGSSWTMNVALGDLDGDGDLDLIEVNYGGPSRVWLNNGAGVFTDTGQALGRTASHAAALGDLDGDGDLDAFVANVEDQSNAVWINDGKGRFTPSGQQFERNSSMCVARGDLDGDGDPDIVAGRFGAGALVLLNDGKGRFGPGQQLGAATAAGVALGDVDSDGDLDLVTGGWSENKDVAANIVWINDGKGRFVQAQSLDEPGRRVHSGVALGDVNGDGRLDVVLGFGGGDRIFAVWLNDGKGRFHRASDMAGSGSVHGLALADLDRDGDLDLALAQEGPNTIWINNGRGEFTDSGLRLGNALSSSVAIGDLNRDGALDLVFADSDPGATARTAPNAVWIQRRD